MPARGSAPSFDSLAPVEVGWASRPTWGRSRRERHDDADHRRL